MPTPTRTRTTQLMIRLRYDERSELEAIAAHRRLSLSDTFRMIVREEFDRAGLAKPAKVAKKPKVAKKAKAKR